MKHESDRTYLEDEADDGFGLEDLLRILKRYWRTIGIVTIAVAAIAAQISMLMPNRYEAVATVQVEQRVKQIVDIDGVLQDLTASTSAIESEVEVIRSSNLALAVIEHLKLRQDPEFSRPSFSLLSWLPGFRSRGPQPTERPGVKAPEEGATPALLESYLRELSGADAKLERDGVLNGFLKRMKTQRIRNSALIEVRFESADPIKAARIANAIVDIYLRRQIKAKTSANELASKLLNEKIVTLRGKLATAEQNLESFKTAHDIFDADGRSVLDRQLRAETEALVIANGQVAESRARYEQARRLMSQGSGPEAVSDVLESATVRVLRDSLVQASRRQAELRTKYGPRHPEIVKVRADVAKARDHLQREINAIIRNMRTQMDVAISRRDQLKTNLRELKQRIARSKEKSWKLEELNRQAQTSRKLYEALLERNKQTAQTVDLQFPDSRVIQRATVPLSPSGPKRKQIVLVALIGGFMFAFASAFLLEALRPDFDVDGQAERQLMVQQIAALPDLSPVEDADPMAAARHLIAEPRSSYSEAVRGLGHTIARKLGPHSVIMIASAHKDEGGMTLASNLALQFAATGRRTLLIDGDMRNATLSQALRLRDKPGLADVLNGRSLPSGTLLVDSTTSLTVMPAGPSSPSPSALLASPSGHGLFQSLRGHYDVVIVDAPPLLPVADARILADHSDVILMPVKWRSTPQFHVKQAIKLLDANESKLAGMILTGVEENEYNEYLGLQLDPRPRLVA